MKGTVGFFCLAFLTPGTVAVRFASPLQSLTIFDEGVEEPDPRKDFLERDAVGQKAVDEVEAVIDAKYKEFIADQDTKSPGWDERAAKYEAKLRQQKTASADKAYDRAVAKYDEEKKAAEQNKPPPVQNKNKFQFVGVVQRKGASPPIQWYARKKPAGAKWSVRLVHVNRAAIAKDLFDQGKIDLMAKYKNTGEVEEGTNTRIVNGHYEVRKRSWRNLWNFSPKHVITDSSGMYWRERRLRPGLFTDGSMVYETEYRYIDGRNGIRPIEPLQDYLKKYPELKGKIEQKLKTGSPELVVDG